MNNTYGGNFTIVVDASVVNVVNAVSVNNGFKDTAVVTINGDDFNVGVINVNVVGVGTSIPTGNVTVFIDGEEIANIAINGENYSISNLTGGNHIIKVVYNGDNNYMGANSSTQLIVNPISPNYIGFDIKDTYYGDAISGYATVYGSDGKAVPSGNITIFVDGKEIETKTLNINGVMREFLDGILVIRAFNAQKREEEKFDELKVFANIQISQYEQEISTSVFSDGFGLSVGSLGTECFGHR